MRRRILFALFLLLSSAIVQPAVSAPLKVVATFSVLGDMVKQIAGERVALTTIVGADADSESYEPTAADARAVAEADLLIMNGFNPEFEPWLDGLLHQAQFHGTRIVASNGIRTLKRAEEGSTFAPSSADEYDQHAWNDAANAAVYATNIAAALLQLDRSHAEEYRKRGETYRRELFNLDAWAKQRVADIPVAKRKVITSHDAFGYLARAYGIRVVSARGWTTEKEPTAAQVAGLIQQIRQDSVRAIFIENMSDPRLIQRIAREAGGTVGGELYSDALTRPGQDGDTYVKMFRHNIEALCAGMMKN